MVLCRTKSHRARERMERILGTVQYYFIWGECAGELFYCPDDKLAEVTAIKGITRARVKGTPSKCWELA